jgi:hypothetical protein
MKLIAINGERIWPWHIVVPFERFGAETQNFKIADNISSFVEWLHNELKLMPDTMSKVGNYGAATCSEMLLHLLEQQGCENFKAFRSRSFEFPSSEDVPA